ncbi:MAG TPA: ComF family protein [Azospirillaceae bacterium]|nr:ComF family protein [Azospirillaceae bacterium]
MPDARPAPAFPFPALRAGLARALDLLLPPRCLGCGVDVERTGALCPDCWKRMAFIARPHCERCGLPFEFEAPDTALCGGCAAVPPAYGRCRAVLAYDDASRPLLLAFKHGDRTDAAAAFGPWLARAGAELLKDADLLVPVPLHRWRLFARRYNQAALLARAAGRAAGVAAAPDLLLRRRRTPSQGGLSRAGRARNVAGAFAVRPGRDALVRGARIVLVDDVYTTGATAEECARVLLRAGAARVDVLALARVVRPETL